MAVQESSGTQEKLRQLRRVDLSKADAGAAPRRSANGSGHLRAVASPVLSEQAIARRAATAMAQATLVASCAETAAHCHDVDVISEGICRHLGVGAEDRERVMAAARLHDVGKVAIPAEILDKPAPLNEREWEIMQAHTIIGEEIVAAVDELTDVAPLVRHSHERWDGRGYPDGLAGGEIPLGSRVVFCADAFHAIRSDRPYRRGRSAAQAFKEIKAGAGTQFDPDVVTALGALMHEMRVETGRTGLGKRSSRLVALLMILTCGVGGSAIARSGLLDSPDAAAALPDAPVAVPSQDPAPGTVLPGGGLAEFAPPSVPGSGDSGSGPEPREQGEPTRDHGPGSAGERAQSAAFTESKGSTRTGDGGAKATDDGKGGGGANGEGRPAAQDAPAGGGKTQGSPAQGGGQGGVESPGGDAGAGAQGHSKDKANGNANGHDGTNSSGGQGQGRSGDPPGNSDNAPGNPGHVPPAGTGANGGGPSAGQSGHGGGRGPVVPEAPPAPKPPKPKPEPPAPAPELAPPPHAGGATGKGKLPK